MAMVMAMATAMAIAMATATAIVEKTLIPLILSNDIGLLDN